MRKLFLALLFASASFAGVTDLGTTQVSNWNGYSDTCYWFVVGSGTVKYSKIFNLTDYENMRVLAMGSDTVVAGFAADSIKIQWGYQTGSLVKNYSGSLDTAWDRRIVIDTMDNAKYAPGVGYADSTGSVYRGWGASDTVNVARFAVQSRSFAPEWDQLIRFWCNGLTNNKGETAVKFVLDIKRRLFTNTRNK